MVRSVHSLVVVSVVALFVSPVDGQTVQLPSYRWFSVNTAVMAPDRGSGHLGGVRRSSLGSRQSGVPGAGKIPGLGRLFGNRAMGGSTGTSSTSVHVTVIDHESVDRAVLAEARRRRGASPIALAPATAQLSEELSAGVKAAAAQEPGGLMSVAEIRQLNARRKASAQEEARRLAVQGKEAEEQGSLGAAKIYYQMAYRRADPDLQKQLAVRIKDLANRNRAPIKTAHR